MKWLVTGATGFLGSRLCLHGREQGWEMAGLGRLNNPAEEENARELLDAGVTLHEVSILEREPLAEVMQGAEVVVHLAAAQHEANVPDEYFRSINVDGTRNVLECAAAAKVARVVHGSTIGVYGWKPGTPVDEDSPLEPENVYGVTKLAGEEVVRGFRDVPWSIVRISEAYGPGDRRLLKLFKAAERGISLQIGPGSNRHHLVHVDDVIAGLVHAARDERALGRCFVLAGPHAVTSRDMLEAVARALGVAPRRLQLPMAPLLGVAALLEHTLGRAGIQPPLHRRRMDFFRKSFEFSLRDAAELGFKPRVGLDEGMRTTAAWYVSRGLVGAP